MTYNEIKAHMIKTISSTLEATLEDLEVERLIDADAIDEFLWEKDYGMELVESFIEEHKQELVEDFLESIYNDIGEEDLDSPF